ncbi:hypothetical protein CJD36_021380 [Flavipsychrobacter stenotrophus]|uniref:Uncharacterized protein n=1 Tax=Flavipsychrobacter stenotrophus TaxID=2077091 RepID=A0A2S7SQD0_9BACT|nr:hypothetical protein [Flavipsychrobacter stenotrophus]PQJ08964.1 hypothetical protein CJD36_021380 [Flavipsychrobacter stenotrophus]
MKFPFPELVELLDEYNKTLSTAQSKAIFVRGIELQKAQVLEVEKLVDKLEKAKLESIELLNEKKANFLLSLIFAAIAIKEELKLIISLKEDNTDAAWVCLVNAQQLIETAVRIQPFHGQNLMGYGNKLQGYETLLFPSMKFASRGCIVGITECSICNQNFADCDHLKGYAYMGKICSEIIHEIIEIEEISLVDNPADKLCRILSFSGEEGKKLDIFTHREITEIN